MFGAAALLTLATLAGLATGFAREWLIVAAWGSGARSDAFLVAMFLPEALRMMMAGGLVNSAALPLYQEQASRRRAGWLAGQSVNLGLVGLALALALAALAPALVAVIGPGLAPAAREDAAATLRMLAWCLPGICLQALWSVPHQAASRFVRAGLASFLYNLPAVCLLGFAGHATDATTLAACFVGGSVLMCVVLLPGMRAGDAAMPSATRVRRDTLAFYARLAPLVASSAASQGLTLLERMAASLIGEGAVTLANLARKLVNLPLIALVSLNQVLLGRMSAGIDARRRLDLLRAGLALSTLLTLPAAVAIVAAAPTLVAVLMPAGLAAGPLPNLLAWYACVIVFGSWNALLARYSYAVGDTRTPLACELAGSALNAAGLLLLPHWFGLPGLALSALAGVIATGALLLRKNHLFGEVDLARESFAAALPLALAAACVHALQAAPAWQVATAVALALACALAAGLRLPRLWAATREHETSSLSGAGL
ncbi:MAG TPA: lipid II flippase MurJ [Burkholderiaceae bacterium]|nr:lipid II flippase MurJ [Burkholderiaceae bacterium]